MCVCVCGMKAAESPPGGFVGHWSSNCNGSTEANYGLTHSIHLTIAMFAWKVGRFKSSQFDAVIPSHMHIVLLSIRSVPNIGNSSFSD